MSKHRIGRILLYVIVFVLVASGIFKFVGAEALGEGLGNANAPYLLAVVELLIASAILIPITRMLGIILAASYFGGAICAAWLIEGEFPIVPIVVNTLLYVGAYLYRPSLGHGGDGEAVVPIDATTL